MIYQKEMLFYLMINLKLLQKEETSSYNPTLRPWYKLATSSTNSIKTDPYKFSHIDTFGITYSKELENSKNVVSIDVLVDDF